MVDDEPFVAETTVMVLNVKGYDAVCVYSGEDAISRAVTFRPDIAILDVMMDGGMNGIEASLALLQLAPDCRIVLVSGRQETAQLLQKAIGDGHDIDVLAKPVHPQFLLDTLANLLPAPPHPLPN